MLRRVADTVVILRDGDSAGLKAARRDFEALLPSGMELKVCVLPDKMDPDDFVRVNTPVVHALETVEA